MLISVCSPEEIISKLRLEAWLGSRAIIALFNKCSLNFHSDGHKLIQSLLSRRVSYFRLPTSSPGPLNSLPLSALGQTGPGVLVCGLGFLALGKILADPGEIKLLFIHNDASELAKWPGL